MSLQILRKTSLKSYYYPNYGFVKLEYSNINETKMVIDLMEVEITSNNLPAIIVSSF